MSDHTLLSTTNSFAYRPLQIDSIRLLTINGDQKHPQCRLEDFADALRPSYHALSYAWGNSPACAWIECNDQTLMLTEHLCEAIRCIYRMGGVARIWIDAVCINQADDVEKSAQVQKMGGIFGDAEAVIVWLGSPEDDSDLVIDEKVVQSLSEQVESINLHGFPAPEQAFESFGLPAYEDTIWCALQQLYHRDWFYRLWAVQEIVLAHEVRLMCGNLVVGWEDFEELSSGLVASGLATFLGIGHETSAIIHLGYTKQLHRIGVVHLDSLFYLIRNRRVTKRVDRAYGALHCLGRDITDEVKVDYAHKEVSYWRPYLALASTLVRNGFLGDVLSLASSANRPPWLPTWCPNLNSKYPEEISFVDFEYSAGLVDEKQTRPRLDVEDLYLRVHGFRVDVVKAVHGFSRDPPNF